MFGAVAIMVDDAMLVAVNGDNSLLVRIDPSEAALLRSEPDASPAEMGTGRTMGDGWLHVDLDPDGRRLGFWVDAALRRRRG